MKFGLRGSLRTGVSSSSPSGAGESITRLSLTRKPLESRAARKLMERLSAQQASLVRSVALGDEEYLSRSFYVDPDTGKRVAYELDEEELKRFQASWGVAPVLCIGAMNRAIAHIAEPARRDRYLRAAVDLEILMDAETWAADGERVHRGIPGYLMNGYTDMGGLASPTERYGREKIKVDKAALRERLVECKRRGIEKAGALDDLLRWCYEAVRRDIEFDELGVERLSKQFGNESIVLSEYLDKGMGVCRHLSIFFQLYVQEAGVESRVVKGNLKFYVFSGRHAWNLVTVPEGVALVDVTHPHVDEPFILRGTGEEDVYAAARAYSREYAPTPDAQNHYKIGVS